MHLTAYLASQILDGYVIVEELLAEPSPAFHGTGSRESAVGIVADVTGDPLTLQATLWRITPSHAERLGVYAGALFGPEATI